MQARAIQFFSENNISIKNFDYFDYAQFFTQLSRQDKSVNPTKRKIIQRFLSKCEQKISQKKNSHKKWNNFLQRMEMHKAYSTQKSEAMQFLRDKYDEKSKQLLFYPKTNRRLATQQGRCWKDQQDVITEQESIPKPNDSTFAQ